MKKNKIVFIFWIAFTLLSISTNGLHAQFSVEQIKVANQTYVYAEGCKLRLDTISSSYDALVESDTYLSKANETLLNDLGMSKQVSFGLQQENELNKKLLKKEIRKKKLNAFLLYSVTGVAVVTTILLLVK